jgi:hypothetical protein
MHVSGPGPILGDLAGELLGNGRPFVVINAPGPPTVREPRGPG